MGIYDDATVMIAPAAREAGKFQAMLPQESNKVADVLFSRNCKAAEINANGYVKFVPANMPRFSHKTGKPRIYREQTRTNLVLFPFSLEDSWWDGASGLTVGLTNKLAPFRDSNGEPMLIGRELKESADSSATLHYFGKTLASLSVNGYNTISCMVQKNVRNAMLEITDGTTVIQSKFDLKAKTVITGDGTIEEIGIDYAIVSLTRRITNSSVIVRLYSLDGENENYQGTGSVAFQASAFQFEKGNGRSLIINDPEDTEGTQETRLADSYQKIDAGNIPSEHTMIINDYAVPLSRGISGDVYMPSVCWNFAVIDRKLTDQEIEDMGLTKATAVLPYHSENFSITIKISGTGIIDWGDGERDSYNGNGVVISHSFKRTSSGIAFIGTLTYFYLYRGSHLLDFNIANLPDELGYIYVNSIQYTSGDIANAPTGLTYMVIKGTAMLSGDIANAPAGLTYISIGDKNILSGDIANAPAGLTGISITGNNTLSGDIANAPAGLTIFYITGNNTLSGDIANAPSGLIYFRITGNNTLSGDIANAPAKATTLNIQGNNTLSGDIANAPAGLTYITIAGNNTLSGDIANAPAGLTYISIGGNNTLSGNILYLKAALRNVSITGNNTLSGDIANAPAGLTFLYITGNNTLSGDIANAPAKATTLNIQGNNTLSGDIANAPAGLTIFYITGNNTLSGDIANAPAKVTTLNIQGNNTIGGTLPSTLTALAYIYITGNNTIGGDFALIPTVVTSLYINQNQFNQYTSGHSFSDNVYLINFFPAAGYGLTSSMIDNLLIDLDASGMHRGDINLTGANAPRTSASDAAVASLQSKGVSVTTN